MQRNWLLNFSVIESAAHYVLCGRDKLNLKASLYDGLVALAAGKVGIPIELILMSPVDPPVPESTPQ
jgi:hypothetical protein